MKFISAFINRKEFSRDFFLKFTLSPYISTRSLLYHHGKDQSLFIRFFTFTFLTVASVPLIQTYLKDLNYLKILIMSPMIYFLTESLGAFAQIVFYKVQSFSIHRSPWAATSLSHFWGRDWNLWVQDWLRDVSKTRGKRKKSYRILVVFIISGLFHEMMINFPYWLMFGKSYFGTMMAYFCIQGLALYIDKKVIHHYPKIIRRIYMWLAIILPSPLFINVPLLTFFGLEK